MTFNYWMRTESGNKRKINEDSVEGFIVNGTMFLMIADGFGVEDDNEKGYPAGYLATQLAKNYIEKFYIYPGEASLRFVIQQTFYHINEIIKQYSIAHPERYRNYGCSFTLAAVTEDMKLYTIHAGITRLYLMRGEGIFQGTKDHNEATVLLDKGELTEEDFIVHPGRNLLTKALGFDDDILSDISVVQLQRGDFILLLSDGVYRSLGNPRIQALVYEAGELEQACNWLIDGAIELDTPDNVSAVISYII